MVKVRYKMLFTGKFSAYLDVYSNTGKGKRNYEFLHVYVDKDFSHPTSRTSKFDLDSRLYFIIEVIHILMKAN
ncbi:MAG: hypothetical protein ACOH2A_13870 [Sphingobacteriaceae bacterium]